MWNFPHLDNDAGLMFALDTYLPISITSHSSYRLPT
jgi:hypothetical protein